MPSTSFMGATIRRREDPRLITGSATYVDDVHMPGMVYLSLLRCPYAHARISALNLESVRALPGVLGAVDGEMMADLGAGRTESDEDPLAERQGEESGGGPRPPLAVGAARFAGEGVAAIVTEDRYGGLDALDQIEVEYEPLSAYLDVERPPADPVDFPGATVGGDGYPVGTEREFSWGDVDAAFDNGAVVVSERMVNQRLAPLPMETRGVVAAYHPGARQLTVYNSTQCAQFVRDAICEAFGMPRGRVRVIAPEVGGGFGCKIGKYPEDVLACYFAMKLNRPVKWIESRSENFLTTTHGRSQIGTISLAAGGDGKLLGIRLELIADSGAYDAGWLCSTTSGMVTGCYDIPNGYTHARSILTNKTPLGAYRGAGRPEAAYFVERAMDLLAGKLSITPDEVRRRNFLAPEAFPHSAPDWPVFDSGSYGSTMETALARVNMDDLIVERDRERSEGKLAGIGLASYVEVTGFGWETSTVTIEADGTALVSTGISPHGQGQETTFAQIVADQCGLTPEDVTVTYGDTKLGYGQGTMGSRGTSVGGTAVVRATVELREKMREIAANRLEAAPEDLELEDGAWHVKGVPDRMETVRDIAKAACDNESLSPGMKPGLQATGIFAPEDVTAPFGTHVAVVAVDRDTGQVELRKLLTVDDCGTIISPQLVEGQVHGGVMQGIAQALWEEVIYDPEGQLLTGAFASYAIPTIGEMPPIEVTHTCTPSTRNELGVKGVGEAGSIGSTPAVVNAVMDALSPMGIEHLDMPLTPLTVWTAIRDAEKDAGSHVAAG